MSQERLVLTFCFMIVCSTVSGQGEAFEKRLCAVSTSFEMTACDSFYYNNILHHNSGIYPHKLSAQNMCDSIVVLDLSIDLSTPIEQCVNLDQVLANDGAAGDEFGFSVAIEGNTAAIGAYRDDAAKGAVYIYNYNGSNWVQQQKLTGSTSLSSDRFGYSIDISGDFMAISAYLEDNNGAVYIFKKNGASWQEHQRLIASDGKNNDFFGRDVGIWDKQLIVGASGDDRVGSLLNAGAAYFFSYEHSTDQWVEKQIVFPATAALGDGFGGSVAISGNIAIVGEKGDDDKGNNAGAAFVYEYNTNDELWEEKQKLTASNGQVDADFGLSVDVSGDVAVVGAISEDVNSETGSVYVFKNNGSSWTEQQIISGENPGDHFGRSVSIDGRSIIISAEENDESSSNGGAAYVYQKTGKNYTLTGKLMAEDAASGDRMGMSAAISRRHLITGANLDNTSAGSDAGSVYFFEIIADTLDIDTCNAFNFGGVDRTNSGIYSFNYSNAHNCDSLVTINLNISSSPIVEMEETYVCSINDTGKITTSILAANGCDSILRITTATYAGDPIVESKTEVVCTLAEERTESDTIYSKVSGCDSVIRTTIFSANEIDSIATVNLICGDGNSDTIINIQSSSMGCDSLVQIEINLFRPEYFVEIDKVTSDQAAVGIEIDSFETVYGCDSIITTNTIFSDIKLFVVNETSCNASDVGVKYDTIGVEPMIDSIVQTITTLLPSYNEVITKESCNPDEVGEFSENLKTKKGCDSVITTIVTLTEGYFISQQETTCDEGEVGTFEEIFTSSYGCDSTVSTTVTLREGYFKSQEFFTCNEDSVGTNTEVFVSAQGCDSTVTTTTVLLPSYQGREYDTTCIKENADTLALMYTSSFGCDSTIELITIYQALTYFLSDTFTSGNPYVLPNGESVFEPGTYESTATAEDGCDTTIVLTLIDDTDLLVNLPTAFTPNDDAFNDVLYAYSENINIKEFEMLIYDRIGELVFQSNDISIGWDGTFKNRPMNSGVFIVSVKVQSDVGQIQEFKQQIKLMR